MFNSKVSIQLILDVLKRILNDEEYNFLIEKLNNNNCLFSGNALGQIVEYLFSGDESILQEINDIDLFEYISIEDLKEEHRYEDYRGNAYSSIPSKEFFFLYPEYSGKVSLVKIHCYSLITDYFKREYMSNWTNLYMTKDELYIGNKFNKFILTKELKLNSNLDRTYFILALDKMQNKIIKSKNRYKEADFIYHYFDDNQQPRISDKYQITNSTYGCKLIHNCKVHKKVHKLARTSSDSNYIEFVNKCKVTENINKKYLEYAYSRRYIIDFTNKSDGEIENLYNLTISSYVKIIEEYYKHENIICLSHVFEQKGKEIWDIRYEINKTCQEKGYPIYEEDLILQFNSNISSAEILKMKNRISNSSFLKKNIVYDLLLLENPNLLKDLEN